MHAISRLDEGREDRRRRHASRGEPEHVEHRDGEPAKLDGKELAHGEVGGTGRGGGDEEHGAPERGLGGGGEEAAHEQPAGDREEEARDRVGDGDHLPAADGVEEPAEEDRAEEVADGKRQDVEAHAIGRDAVEAAEDERVGEEDRVVGEGLRDHEREAQDRSAAVLDEEHAGDVGEADLALHLDRRGRASDGRKGAAGAAGDVGLDGFDDLSGLADAAVEEQPARALGEVAADEEHRQAKERAQAKREPPADRVGDDARVEQHQRRGGADRGAEPVGAVEGEIGAAAHPGGDELVDGGVHRGALAADAHPGDRAEQRE